MKKVLALIAITIGVMAFDAQAKEKKGVLRCGKQFFACVAGDCMAKYKKCEESNEARKPSGRHVLCGQLFHECVLGKCENQYRRCEQSKREARMNERMLNK